MGLFRFLRRGERQTQPPSREVERFDQLSTPPVAAVATAVTSTIALKKGQLAQGLDAQFGTLIHALPQLSWAEAFSGASDTHRNPDFKLPAPVEEAWAGAYAAMGKKMAWQVDLDGQPGTVIALSPGAADRGVRFAVFDADGKCLSSGYARETSEGWATESKGTEPIWVTERHEQQLQQQRAAADQARLADEYRAAQAQAPAASVAQREYASKLVAQAFRGQGPAAMLVPAPGQPQGFRAAQVTPYHAAGFAIEAARVPEWAPAPELLAEVAQGAPQRPLLIPEVYSEKVGRNVRFAVFLPPGFDPQRAEKYDVVQVVPNDPRATLASAVAELRPFIERRLAAEEASEAVVIVPERVSANAGPWPQSDAATCQQVLDVDLHPFLEAHFNADEAAIASWSWPDAGSATAPAAPEAARARAAQPDRAGPVLWSREEAPPAVATPASAPEAAPGRAAPPDRAGPVQWSREEAPPAVTTPARREVAPAAPVSFDGLGLPSEAAAALDDVVRRLPALGAPLVDLVKKRPGLFAGPDAVTGKSFAVQLRAHVATGQVRPAEVAGLTDFLSRLDDQAFNFRRSGYSHAGGLLLALARNHPGLVLELIDAARTGRDYPLRRLYDGDGAGVLRPTRQMAAGFETSRGVMAFEEGLVTSVVDQLKPHVLPADRLTVGRCQPVAIGVSKLTGQDVRYAYAFNLKTGDDLVAALETQGGEGLSMADVEFTDRSGKRTFCHFPTFSDYDPATRTVALQDFSKAPRRVSVEGLRFSEKGDTRPALYYRAHPGMERFLTPEEHPTRESYRPPAKLGWGEDYD